MITIQVLQDIFDVSTTSRCGQLFEIVENNIDKWKTVRINFEFIVFYIWIFKCLEIFLRFLQKPNFAHVQRLIEATLSYCGHNLLRAYFDPFGQIVAIQWEVRPESDGPIQHSKCDHLWAGEGKCCRFVVTRLEGPRLRAADELSHLKLNPYCWNPYTEGTNRRVPASTNICRRWHGSGGNSWPWVGIL